jgi:hypothetical protein
LEKLPVLEGNALWFDPNVPGDENAELWGVLKGLGFEEKFRSPPEGKSCT